MLNRRTLLPIIVVLLALAFESRQRAAGADEVQPPFDAADLDFFEKEVRPVLARRCYECHGPEAKVAKGGLRLDSRAGAIAGGDTGPAIVPGDAAKSMLVDAINYGDLYEMPPKSKLPEAEIAALTKWVARGAPWPREDGAAAGSRQEFDLDARRQSHWCWRPVQRPSLPVVRDQAWPHTPIDRLLLARLEQEGLSPAEDADRRTLLRRVYFDLIGLPPSPAEVEAFLEDESPDAWEKLVDRLLASPHFGERWGRHWLDLVRYAESRGHEFDYDVANAWQYRDYVIRAIAADIPYDRFVVEHVAGDLLAEPRKNPTEGFNESVLGTGFWHFGEWIHSPVDIRQDEADRFDNMIDVFSKTFLALTVACARCHDHKFDAVRQRDYYALAGYLQSSEYRQVRFDSLDHNRDVARRLEELERETKRELAGLLADSQRPALKRLDEYLLAAAAPSEEYLLAVAGETHLDPSRLRGWIAHLRAAADDRGDPFHAFARVAAIAEPAGGRALPASLADGRRGEEASRSEWAGTETVVDYSRCRPSEWLIDGVSFGLSPVRAGELLLGEAGEPPAGVATQGYAHRRPEFFPLSLAAGTQGESGKLADWDRAGKALRTPTFDINRQNVYYLVRGSGHAYLVVDSHRMVNGPLHGSLVQDFQTESETKWITHPAGGYVGHNAHMEFIARGSEPLDVLMVVQGDSAPPLPDLPISSSLAEALADADGTAADLAGRYRAIFLSVSLAPPAGPWDDADSAAADAPLADWLVRHPELVAESGAENDARRDAVLDRFRRQRAVLLREIQTASRTAPAMWDGSGWDERLLIRGNPHTPGEPVPRGLPAALAVAAAASAGQPDSDAGSARHGGSCAGSGRRALAEALIDPQNPLVSRVVVNRLWQHLFGVGIVPSVDNFGLMGEAPSHPELLDWLAGELVRREWSLKAMVRLMVTSRAYRMSSGPTLQDSADPRNRLLHRMRIRRLEGEIVRDAVLAVSGRLDPSLGGPSVPVHLTPFMQGRGRPGVSGPVDGAGRRSVYLSVRRNFLSPLMLAFDVPQPSTTMGRRNVSNVPAQALALMNDPFILEQANRWAERLLAEADSPEQCIEQAYQAAFSRPPSAVELDAALGFLQSQAAELGIPPEQAGNNPRVWADLCHVLLNVKEFIFIR